MEIKDLKNITVGTKVILDYKGVEIPIFFRPAATQSNAVIFTFHGAVNRKERELPIFGPILPELIASAHQVAIFDISLFRHESHGTRVMTSWIYNLFLKRSFNKFHRFLNVPARYISGVRVAGLLLYFIHGTTREVLLFLQTHK